MVKTSEYHQYNQENATPAEAKSRGTYYFRDFVHYSGVLECSKFHKKVGLNTIKPCRKSKFRFILRQNFVDAMIDSHLIGTIFIPHRKQSKRKFSKYVKFKTIGIKYNEQKYIIRFTSKKYISYVMSSMSTDSNLFSFFSSIKFCKKIYFRVNLLGFNSIFPTFSLK